MNNKSADPICKITKNIKDSFTTPPPADIAVSLKTIKHSISHSMLDPDAIKIIKRLNNFGYSAYLVGGCVRDILLEKQPKDFDIVTSAMPAEIRNIFRNCRLIGRRFRLAHLHFKNQKIIEVATFRRSPNETDDITRRHSAENLFGTPADDAVRRDFTINALMYDISKKEIMDWTQGLDDIKNGVLKTIGDPSRRFKEDPVRILRAIKFGERLNLKYQPELLDAAKINSHLIQGCSHARLIEELFKLIRSGYCEKIFHTLHYLNTLKHLMPKLNEFISKPENHGSYWLTLTRIDEMITKGQTVHDSVLLASLLFDPCRKLISQPGDITKDLNSLLKKLVSPLPFTRRHFSHLKILFIAQLKLQKGPNTKRVRKIMDKEYASAVIDLLKITAKNDAQIQNAAVCRKFFITRHQKDYI